jgi:hypothetical protein
MCRQGELSGDDGAGEQQDSLSVASQCHRHELYLMFLMFLWLKLTQHEEVMIF